MKPDIKVELLAAEDPTFGAGSSHSAQAVLTNPTDVEWTYDIELYLGVTKVATSGVGSVTIPAGGSATATFSMVMPSAEGVYEVYLDVKVGVDLIKHYKATEDVTIEISPGIEIGVITWV